MYANYVYNCVYNCVYDCVYDCVVSFTTAPKGLRLDIPAVEGGRRGKKKERRGQNSSGERFVGRTGSTTNFI